MNKIKDKNFVDEKEFVDEVMNPLNSIHKWFKWSEGTKYINITCTKTKCLYRECFTFTKLGVGISQIKYFKTRN